LYINKEKNSIAEKHHVDAATGPFSGKKQYAALELTPYLRLI
jgi:hypothetical protein